MSSWGLTSTPAFGDTAPPSTTPTITAPLDGASAIGDVTVSATSTSPTVQFYIDAASYGAPIAVVAGTASLNWPTWGLANLGSHTWTAADCNSLGCNLTQSAAVTVTVGNAAPTVTAPTNGATTDPSLTLQATSPGGGIAFFVDGTQVGFDAATPYSFLVTGPLTDGAHTMFVQECDIAGTACNGPTAGANFTVDSSPPQTTPTITAPADSSAAVGVVVLSATSSEELVQFYLDAAPYGTPIEVVAGTASSSWSTWGLANSGTHAWTAADCNSFGCNATQSASATVSIANSSPAMTAPIAGSINGPSLTLRATSPGGGLAFFVDGIKRGFDASSPYSLNVAGPLADGAHSGFVRECDATGAACNGPSSPAIGFTVKTLHPLITSVSPNPFSPNHDGRGDTTSFRIHLPDAERVSFLVRDATRTVNGPHDLGALGAGDHTYRWDGKTNAGRTAPQGFYTIVVASQRKVGNVTLRGKVTASVRIDNAAPVISGVTGNGVTFYPVVDTYRDTFRPKVTVNEGGGLWMEVFNASGTKVRVISQPHARTGTFQLTWNGRTAGQSMLREGTYRYHFIAQDSAGNRRISANYYVNLSHKRLVNTSVTLSHNGEDGHVTTSDPSCTSYSYALSYFAHGLWLSNVCYQPLDGFQAIFADYSFNIPAAIRYNNIRVQSYGNTISAPEPIAALMYNFSTRQWNTVGAAGLTHNVSNSWSTYGSLAAAGRVSAGRVVKISIAVPNTYYLEDYDIGIARITVSYAVLR